MDALKHFLVQGFLNDMTETVGVRNWVLYTLFAAVVTYGLMETSVIPYGALIGGVMTANLAVATVVSAWWKYHGREKYAYTSVLDLGEMKGRDT